jgi:excisionase family DNA binding protein
MTIQEVAEYLGCPIPSVIRAVRHHDLPAEMQGTEFVVRRRALDGWIQEKKMQQIHPKEKTYLTVQEAADLTGIAYGKIYYHVCKKNLPSYLFMNKRRVKRVELLEWVRKRKQSKTEDFLTEIGE